VHQVLWEAESTMACCSKLLAGPYTLTSQCDLLSATVTVGTASTGSRLVPVCGMSLLDLTSCLWFA
jgi:hypothetical protein